MSTPRFDYPTAAAPTTSVVFTEGYKYPYEGADRRIQVQEESAGGQLYVYDKGVEVLTMDLTFRRLTKALFDQVRAFLRTTVQMGASTFDFTDHDGTVTTVRSVPESFRWSLTDFQHYDCRLSLRKEVT